MINEVPKILIVDDEPDLEMLIRQKFRKEIREGVYEFYFAGNGVEALKQLNDHPAIELILTDINMPEMDGLTLLAKIKELNNPLLHAVIVSAYGDIHNIRTAMNGGAYDFVIKPIDFSDLELTIKKALNNLASFKKMLQNRDELLTVRKELEEARQLQLSMLPGEIPSHPELEIAAYLQTASEVGGDYYDFASSPDGSFNMAIGDATGHGMKAGIMVSIVKTLFVSGDGKESTGHFFTTSDRTIKSLNLGRMMMAFSILNYQNGMIRYINAGMPPVLLLQNGKVSEIENQFMPLGSAVQQSFAEKTFSLNPGDCLLVVSDGFPELFNEDGEQFGYERIANQFRLLVGKTAADILVGLKNAMDSWKGSRELDDDVTLMVIRRR